MPHNVPADMLMPCAGYLGPLPLIGEGMLSDALIAAELGRRCANAKLITTDKILNPDPPKQEATHGDPR